MNDTIFINDNAGRIAYESWVSEFAERISDEPDWDELNHIAKEAWETVASNVIEERITFPTNGVELMIRTATKTIGFVWVGAADGRMAAAVLSAVNHALKGRKAR